MQTMPEAPMGRWRWADIYIKGVSVRFGFDVLESRKFKRLVKNKATRSAPGMIVYTPYRLLVGNSDIACCRLPVAAVVIYTTSTWGFRRCSFRLIGQCESLKAWNE